MAGYIETGVKFKVDASDLDVKFTRSVEQLNASLTTAQRRLGLTYDANKLLTNSLGQCVEGLSTAQIKLGLYVDELGRVRTFQGGFASGVSNTLLAMGAYSDEFGNIYNRAGEFVERTKEASRALEEQEKAARDAARALEEQEKATARALEEQEKATSQALQEQKKAADEAFGKTVDGVSQLSGQFATLLAAVAAADGGLSELQRGLISTAEGVASAGGAFQSLRSMQEAAGAFSFAELANSGKAALATFRGLAVGTTTLRGAFLGLWTAGGPLLPILGAVATGVFAFWATSKAEANAADLLSDSFKKLEALEAGQIDEQEEAALIQKTQNEYAKATESQEKTAKRAAPKPESEKAAASIREGSVDLYRAQIQGEKSFQTKIGSATERAAQATAATVPATTQTANAVATVAATVAPKATEESSFWEKALAVLESIRDAATETRSSSDATAGTLDKILRNAAEVFG